MATICLPATGSRPTGASSGSSTPIFARAAEAMASISFLFTHFFRLMNRLEMAMFSATLRLGKTEKSW